VARALRLLLILAALSGCSATRRPALGARELASDDRDGMRVERVQRIGRELASATAAPERIDLGLSTRDGMGAWSWPDGRIRVSRALVDALDEDELRAAIAHELGHLLDDGAVAGKATALAGGSRHDASAGEVRADAVACALLRTHGANVEALPRMPRTVAHRATPEDEGVDPAKLLARARTAERACAP
jgi:hypothetical protein